jgi:hypothetical protein
MALPPRGFTWRPSEAFLRITWCICPIGEPHRLAHPTRGRPGRLSGPKGGDQQAFVEKEIERVRDGPTDDAGGGTGAARGPFGTDDRDPEPRFAEYVLVVAPIADGDAAIPSEPVDQPHLVAVLSLLGDLRLRENGRAGSTRARSA